jgi:hypothetical protein
VDSLPHGIGWFRHRQSAHCGAIRTRRGGRPDDEEQHGEAEALTFFGMMGEDVQNFWMHIAQQMIDHAKHWKKNEGSACVLDDEESKRIHDLPRHPEL